MLTNLEVFTPGVATPPIPILTQDVSLDAIQIVGIDGLGPVTSNINSTQYGSIDGESYDGSSTPKRNIVLTVQLNPDWASLSIEAIRQILYLYFMPKNQVRLRFSSTHMATVEIVGYVESLEPNMFAKDPVYQISIICTQPYFVAVSQTVITGTTLLVGSTGTTTINYQGNIDTGFVIDFSIPSSGSLPGGATTFMGELRMLNQFNSIKSLWIATGVPIDLTHEARISTVDGSKYVEQHTIPDTSTPYNLLPSVTSGSIFLKLHKGDNVMQFMSNPLGLTWSLSYYARYGGL